MSIDMAISIDNTPFPVYNFQLSRYFMYTIIKNFGDMKSRLFVRKEEPISHSFLEIYTMAIFRKGGYLDG